MAKEIEGIREKLDELLDTQVRPISHRLYPSILRRGLVAALQSLGDQFEATLAIDMQMSEDLIRRERLNPKFILEQVRLAAYRIAEEALTNAIKHAGASGATIEVVLLPNEQLSLTVRDDGGGFDVKGAPTGLGVQMMRDYAEVVGGSCVIHSLPGEGTEVRASLPVGGPDAGHPETVSSSE
jgi:signal transduction histidine kinase